MPKTPGLLRCALYIRSRQGVGPSNDRHYERRPGGVEGDNKGYAYPVSSGLRPSDTRAMNNAPLPGCHQQEVLYIGHRFADGRCLGSEHPSGASWMSPLGL